MIAPDIYQARLQKFELRAQQLNRQLQWMSLLRLLIFAGIVALAYKAVSTGAAIFIISSIGCLLFFFWTIRYYDALQQRVRFFKALAKINAQEAGFVQGRSFSTEQGEEFIDPHHPYSYDLDLFGDGGLYPYVNRCSTEFGRRALAQALLHPNVSELEARQEAIVELSKLIDFRQELQAQGSLQEKSEKGLRHLQLWLKSEPVFASARSYRIMFIFPVLTISLLVYYLLTEQSEALNFFYYSFLLNLAIAFGFGKKIALQLSISESVTSVLQQFAGQLRMIEALQVKSPLLVSLKARLKDEEVLASVSIARLSSLFNYLETIVNLVVSLLLNGIFLFHVHVLYALDQWKKRHASRVEGWLSALGEMEELCSFANLSYNNPGFARPEITKEKYWSATDLGHPLIAENKRIPNSISFEKDRFIILTGSNMSGKSTFLRTIGINMVLARAGSMVCAKSFTCYPFSIRVSMRITDSLQDSESFFYAELKRLHGIIEQLQSGEPTFILLDEILRGTNSHDKHSGTVGLIRKLIAQQAVGIIATHDLAVADLENQHPGYARNYCFESNIVNDELLFDYKLKTGVCSKLSASFLMRKMGIIDG